MTVLTSRPGPDRAAGRVAADGVRRGRTEVDLAPVGAFPPLQGWWRTARGVSASQTRHPGPWSASPPGGGRERPTALVRSRWEGYVVPHPPIRPCQSWRTPWSSDSALTAPLRL